MHWLQQVQLESRSVVSGTKTASMSHTALALGSPNPLAHIPPRNFISLVVDHLASNGLLQSLAVFLPESGLGGGSTSSTATVGTGSGAGPAAEAALSREDVLQALPIPADSALFRRVIRRAEEGEGEDAGPLRCSDGETAAVPGAAAAAADATVVLNASAAVPAADSGGHAEAASSGGGARDSRQQKRVCGLLEALVGEVITRSRAVAVDSNTQTDEAGRSHKENLGERRGRVRGRRRRGRGKANTMCRPGSTCLSARDNGF